MSVQSVDELCVATEATLKIALPQVLALPVTVAYLGALAATYEEIKTWRQLPTIEAIAGGPFPAVAITVPGLVDRPVYKRSSDSWEINVRLGIGIYDRAGDHDATAAKVRNWIAFIRTALLRNVTLGGVADGLTWAGEEYDLLPARAQARTIGAGALAIDVRAIVPNTLGMGLPPVTSTHTQLSVPTQE